MGFGLAVWPHFVQDDRNTGTGNLPSGLAARKAATNDVDWVGHGIQRRERWPMPLLSRGLGRDGSFLLAPR